MARQGEDKGYFTAGRFGAALVQTALLVCIGMSTFEVVKQILHPDISIWESHIVTVIFSTLMATLVAAFVLRRYAQLQMRLQVETAERQQAERALREEATQTAILEERTRIARELHDTLAQAFTGISLQLEAAEETLREDPEAAQTHLVHARTLAQTGLTEARRAVWALRPRALESEALPAALRRSITQLTASTPVRATVSARGPYRPLGDDVETHLLRIAQEAVTNALKHAHPQTIDVELAFGAEATQLVIRDDGTGFDADTEQKRGLGVPGMRERIACIGGNVTLTSEPGEGTTVRVTVPRREVAPGGIDVDTADSSADC